MEKSRKRVFLRTAVGGAIVVLLVAGLAAGASAFRAASTPSANIIAGEKVFTSVGCSACHTFKAAAATGKIGPNLDLVKLTATQITLQVTKGGCAVLTKAACSKYKFSMTPFKSRLTKTQIADVAAFIYGERNHAPLPGTKTTTTPKTTTTTSSPTTTSSTPPTTTTTGTPPTTTTTAAGGGGGGGGGGGDTADGCPLGQTIQSYYTTTGGDGDNDETGASSDGDGCV